MVVSHQTNRICHCLAIVFNCEHHVVVPDETSVRNRRVSDARVRLEHPFEMVLAGHPCCSQQWEGKHNPQHLQEPARASPQPNRHQEDRKRRDDCYEGRDPSKYIGPLEASLGLWFEWLDDPNRSYYYR